MSLDPSVTSIVAVAGAAVGVLGLLLALVATIRLGRMRRLYSVLQGDGTKGSFVDAAARTQERVAELRAEVGSLSTGVDQVRTDLADAIRHVAVVRYDAFGDMGGRLSFSAALLDDAGDGLVFSSINGRSETRTYAKGIKSGSSEAQLSPEEEQVVGWALRGNPPTVVTPRAARKPAGKAGAQQPDEQSLDGRTAEPRAVGAGMSEPPATEPDQLDDASRGYAYLGPEGTFTEAALVSCLRETGRLDGATAPALRERRGRARRGQGRRGSRAGWSPWRTRSRARSPRCWTGSPSATRCSRPRDVALGVVRAARPAGHDAARGPDGRRPSRTPQPQCRNWLRREPAGRRSGCRRRPTPTARGWSRRVEYDAALAGAFAADVLRAGGPRRRRARRRGRADPVRAGLEARSSRSPSPAPTRPRSCSSSSDDHPGALLEILTEFAVRGVNLTRIESRPTGGGHGSTTSSRSTPRATSTRPGSARRSSACTGSAPRSGTSAPTPGSTRSGRRCGAGCPTASTARARPGSRASVTAGSESRPS